MTRVETITAPTLIQAAQEATRRFGTHWHFLDLGPQADPPARGALVVQIMVAVTT